jgi:phage shock protein B
MGDDSMSLTDTLALAILMFPVTAMICGTWVMIVRRQSAKYRGLSPEDQAQMNGLTETARRVEQRVGHLENILDTEAPGWRSRSDAR